MAVKTLAGRLIDLFGALEPGTLVGPADLSSHFAAGGSTGASPLLLTLIRPQDLVVLEIEAEHLQTAQISGAMHLIPDGSGPALLTVHFQSQHIAEAALYQVAAPPPGTEANSEPNPYYPSGPRFIPPLAGDPDTELGPNGLRGAVDARAAGPSRLVLEVPAGETICSSSPGLLEAMSRLGMRVSPRAAPAQPRLVVPTPALGRVQALLRLPNNLTMVPSGNRMVIVAAAGEARSRGTSAANALGGAHAMRVARIATARQVVGGLDPIGGGTAAGRAAAGLDLAIDGRPPLVVEAPLAGAGAGVPEDVTAIEAPFRLILSPSSLSGWKHDPAPVAAAGDAGRVELWHSRLGPRDDRTSDDLIVRAIWARDLELESAPQAHDILPFRQSLDGLDRAMLVRQSADTVPASDGAPEILPQPIAVRRLALSALGAWLDVHGRWSTDPYSARKSPLPAVSSWDHVAPMGRDQYVRVAYPGYLYPTGHSATLVKITERRISGSVEPRARLYQRKFIVVTDPVRRYARMDFPFTELRIEPLSSPDIDDPVISAPPNSFGDQDVFWPSIAAQVVSWKLHAIDHDGALSHISAPLLFVADSVGFAGKIALEQFYRGDHPGGGLAGYIPPRDVWDMQGQRIAFATSTDDGADSAGAGRTTQETISLLLAGDLPAQAAGDPVRSEPTLISADVIVPAIRHLTSSSSATTVRYSRIFLANGFDPAVNMGEVYLELDKRVALSFGSSEHAGGFINPSAEIGCLSRSQGPAGTADTVSSGRFDPADQFSASSALLAGSLPKLFGMFDLTDILPRAGELANGPKLVSEALDAVAGVVKDVLGLGSTLEAAAGAAQDAATRAAGDPKKAPEQVAATQHIADQLKQLSTTASQALHRIESGLDGLRSGDAATLEQASNDITAGLAQVSDLIGPLDTQLAGTALPPLDRARLSRILDALRAPLASADEVAALVGKIAPLMKGIGAGAQDIRVTFDWQPKIQAFPTGDAPIFVPNRPDGLTISVEVRAHGSAAPGVNVLAEMRDFELHIPPGEDSLVQVRFDRMSFRGGSSRKPEVDVVFGELDFLGFLSFVKTVLELIPLDGFSDPPFVDVSPEGVTAGFTVGLPNLAIGVFTLANISLGADARVPFLGKSVTVGFNFCTREKPFTLAVAFLGGGGFLGLRLSPNGLVLLEMSLEFGAILALDFGVASGSVSAMGGVYIRLESDKGSLTGFFRVRGEVDVLHLITASIELYMALTYTPTDGKMVGQARITVAVKVLFFSGSVEVSCERRFAGSNGDPTVLDSLGTSAADDATWGQYCLAFAGA